MGTKENSDGKKDSERPKPDIENLRMWDRNDVGKWIGTQLGIAGTHFETSEDIDTLLDNFEIGIAVVGREIDVDFKAIYKEWEDTKEPDVNVMDRLINTIQDTANNQPDPISLYRFLDCAMLYQWIVFTRRALEDGDPKNAAWASALAAEAAVRLKGRSAEQFAISGYKHSYIAPMKKIQWHTDLIKAAKRLRKNGTRDGKIVGKLLKQFPDKSRSTIYRVLDKHKFFK